MSRLKDLALATYAYANDYDERFPPAHHPGTQVYWWGKVNADRTFDLKGSPLYRYIDDLDTLICPTFNTIERKDALAVGYGYNYRYVGGSYGLFGDDSEPGAPTENAEKARPAKLKEIASTSSTILFADSARWNYSTPGRKPFLEENPLLEPPSRKNPTFHARHQGYGAVAFTDGHVQVFAASSGNRSEKLKDAPAELGHLTEELFKR